MNKEHLEHLEFINSFSQVTPCSFKESDKGLIHNKEELIKQLESLREDAKFNMHNELHEIIFYRDFNALTVAINIIKELDEEPKEEEMKIFRSSKSGMMFEKSKELSYLEFMIIYIESKIDKYEKITTMNMSQIISIYRALICDIKIEIRRMKENAK